MTDSISSADAPPKRSRLPVILGLVLAVLGGGGGFYAVQSGLLDPWLPGSGDDHAAVTPLPGVAFVPIDPVIVGLGPAAAGRHLKFTAQLEVTATSGPEVTLLMPRILDLLNSYLRAVPVAELEDPGAITRIRAQLLRRIQVVTGEGRVRDLLITEFIMN